MKILLVGDVVGRPGRKALEQHLPELKKKYDPDFTIVNGENAAGGFGITGKICNEFFTQGADCITTGNHIWDQKDIFNVLLNEKRLLRPANYPDTLPGYGYGIYQTKLNKRVMVINLMAQLFMEPLDSPFAYLDKLLSQHEIGRTVDAIVVDFHGEATSEKNAFGHYFDGRVSIVVGTHTHIPTADHRILEKGTAFQSDMGMTGTYDSVIGMDKTIATQRFVQKYRGERLRPADGEGTVCGLLVELSDTNGLGKTIIPIRIGGELSSTL